MSSCFTLFHHAGTTGTIATGTPGTPGTPGTGLHTLPALLTYGRLKNAAGKSRCVSDVIMGGINGITLVVLK